MELNETDYELGLLLASPPRLSHGCQLPFYLTHPASPLEDTPKREVKGARRVRNACLQCRERKIRCSRTYPCKGCVSRGDGAACDWQGGFPTGNIPIHRRHAADQRRQIEELKDRLKRAQACLSVAVQRDSTFNFEINESQSKPSSGLSMLSPRETQSWFSSGSSSQPPGSAESNISQFSIKTLPSCLSWSHDDLAAYSLPEFGFFTSSSTERDPSRLFELSHKRRGYQALSMLREEDGKPVDASGSYYDPSPKLTTNKPSTFSGPATIRKALIHPNCCSSLGTPKLKPRSKKIPECKRPLPLEHDLSLAEANSGSNHRLKLSQVQDSTKGLNQLPLLTSLLPSEAQWRLTQPRGVSSSQNARLIQVDHHHLRPRELAELESTTPNRSTQNFNLPYAASLRTNGDASSAIFGSLCHQYLPQRQYLAGQAVGLQTEPSPFNFRELSWDPSLSQNMPQGTQADAGLGLVSIGEPYGLVPSGFSLGKRTSHKALRKMTRELIGVLI